MRAWFYKNGVGKIFEDGIMPEGWTDHPLGMSADIIAAREAKEAGIEEKPEEAPKKKTIKKKFKKAE